MLDIAVSYNRYKFLGHEFLTWLWHVIDRDQGAFTDTSGTAFSLVIGNRIVCENIVEDNTVETVTIKGDNAGLEEGRMALRKGAVVTEMSLSLRFLEQNWEFNLKGENFHLTGFKHPETEKIQKKEDREGALLEKVFLYGKAVELMDHVFGQFMRLRLSKTWTSETVNQIRSWINR
ncbi:hypothetical protein JCM14469_25590 [Desulfatiferula olefinivorans]